MNLLRAFYRMYYAFKSKYGYTMKGRTIGGIATELTLHWAAFKMHIKYDNAKEADIGAAFKYKNKGNWGYDSNAIFFEGVNAYSIFRKIMNGDIWSYKSLIKNIGRYF